MGFGTGLLALGFVVLGPKRMHAMLGHVARAKAEFDRASRGLKSQLTAETKGALQHGQNDDQGQDKDDLIKTTPALIEMPSQEAECPMIRRCDDRDFELIWTIINDGAQAYKGTIPADRWTEPYMSRKKLQDEIDEGVVFWGYEEAGALVGVMGIQQVQDVTLVRHAYVRTSSQKRGIGGHLLSHLRELASGPMLIGTWAAAVWAIHFYERHGFQMVSPQEKDLLLKRYWTVPERQIDTSVVLADPKWWHLSVEA